MALSDLVLNKGEIMLRQTAIENFALDNSPFLIGNVESVNALSDRYAVDDKVLFDAGTSTKFTFDDEFYYLTTEDNVHLTFTNI